MKLVSILHFFVIKIVVPIQKLYFKWKIYYL